MRAAANSMARGSPSRRTQISAMAGAFGIGQLEFRLDRLGARDEEGDCLILRQCREIGQVSGIGDR